MKDEIRWLIETTDHKTDPFYVSRYPKCEKWTPVPHRALSFTSEEDANSAMLLLKINTCVATEHIFEG